ncbi:MAG: DNA repair protein RecN [Actinomycetota bacterium]|nr:DNA repair protein RecN [Actinomycetota bacterium]
MLLELRVENLLLLERAELRLAGGLNVLTGETGAGKTVLAHALDLLLGGRARANVVRPGAAEAYVEGVFELPGGLREALGDRLPEGAEELVLARRVGAEGRTRAYLNGRAAGVGELREVAAPLIAFYGQHEHRKLTLAAAQLDVLDAHCGSDHLATRARLMSSHDEVRRLDGRVAELRELAGARERELDLLAFELDEIEAATPSEEEAQALVLERDRLRHLETLRGAAASGTDAIGGEAGVSELLAGPARQLGAAAEIDPALGAVSERLHALLYEAEDLRRELRSYVLEIEAPPGRLEEVEERLSLFARLERKHGGTIGDVLAHAERCRTRREELEHAEVALGAAEEELSRARVDLDGLAVALTERRAAVAPRLADAVRGRLAELAMPDAKFEVELSPRPEGCGPRGADRVELLIAPNPDVPAGPLRDVASGGELSRVMLALLSVAHGCAESADGSAPLLVFDEVDAGIGGHTARAVGEHLRELARGRQILCITHLPQVAALAKRHFTISKDSSTVPTTTTVADLRDDAIVAELVRMLGAGNGDRAASQHARQLLRAA